MVFKNFSFDNDFAAVGNEVISLAGNDDCSLEDVVCGEAFKPCCTGCRMPERGDVERVLLSLLFATMTIIAVTVTPTAFAGGPS